MGACRWYSRIYWPLGDPVLNLHVVNISYTIFSLLFGIRNNFITFHDICFVCVPSFSVLSSFFSRENLLDYLDRYNRTLSRAMIRCLERIHGEDGASHLRAEIEVILICAYSAVTPHTAGQTDEIKSVQAYHVAACRPGKWLTGKSQSRRHASENEARARQATSLP